MQKESILERSQLVHTYKKNRRRKDEKPRILKSGLKQILIFWFVQMNTEKIK